MRNINLEPDRRKLRQFGFIALAFFFLLGGLTCWRKGLFGVDFGEATWPSVLVFWGIGALSGVFSLVAPGANRLLYVGLAVITYPIGYVISHVVMALLFYGVITPVGLIMRLAGRDPLNRNFDRKTESYWEPHHQREDKGSYFKQF